MIKVLHRLSKWRIHRLAIAAKKEEAHMRFTRVFSSVLPPAAIAVNRTPIQHFPGVPVEVRSGGPFIAAQTVRIYADPGTTVGASQEVPVGQPLSQCNMQLSGYTTPAP
jgi:hypothetical protein